MITALLLALSPGCNSEKKEVTKDGQTIPVDETKGGIPSVCIWDKAAVKSEPNQKGKVISTMALGEKILCLGDETADSIDKNRKYYKVKLSDNKEGWVSEYAVAVNAQPAVAVSKAPLYLRPDPLTVTDKEFSTMEFVAISNMNKDWCEAKGKENKKKGWIKLNTVSTKDVDITVAILAARAMAESDKNTKRDKIEAILNDPAYSTTVFTDYLSNELEKLWPSAPAERTEAQADSTGE